MQHASETQEKCMHFNVDSNLSIEYVWFDCTIQSSKCTAPARLKKGTVYFNTETVKYRRVTDEHRMCSWAEKKCRWIFAQTLVRPFFTLPAPPLPTFPLPSTLCPALYPACASVRQQNVILWLITFHKIPWSISILPPGRAWRWKIRFFLLIPW